MTLIPRLILFLAFAVFVASIKSSSSQSSSRTYHSTEGSTGRISVNPVNPRRGPSNSVESGNSAESGFSVGSGVRRPLVRSPPRGHQPGTSNSPSRNSPPLDREQSTASTSSSRYRERQFARSRSPPVAQRLPNSPERARQPSPEHSSSYHTAGQTEFSDSNYESPFSGSSFMSTPSRPYSPRGPYSFEYNSPSQTSSDSRSTGSNTRRP